MSLHVKAINVHPVKSTAIRPVPYAGVDRLGLVGDRRWMVVDAAGECVTARELRALFRVVADTPQTIPGLGCALRLRVDGMPEVRLSAPSGPKEQVSVFGRPLHGIRIPEADVLLAEVTGRRDVSLVALAGPRRLNPHYGREGDATGFVDGYPVTLASAASVDQVQEWIGSGAESDAPQSISADRFRPNLIVEGDLEPFAEDRWQGCTIGDVTFRVAKGIDRCVMTTIDPGDLSGGPEPIRTLARYRKRAGKTWFGIHLIPDGPGHIRVGDAISVTRAEAPRASKNRWC